MIPEKPEQLVLDPHALPAETRGRFAMLMVAVLTIAGSLGALAMGPWIMKTQVRILEQIRQVTKAPAPSGHPPSAEPWDPVALTEQYRGASQVVRESLPETLFFLVLLTAGLGLFLGTTWLHYRFHPHRLRRRLDCRPLEPAEAPRTLAFLRSWVQQLGLAKVPRLECTPGRFSLDGQAFGLKGREVLTLSQDPRLLEAGWSDSAKAVALHELAHLVNGDTWHREAARSLWLSLAVSLSIAAAVPAGLVPFLAPQAAWQTLAKSWLWLLLRSAGLLLIIRWIWRGLIRTREHYADWRVATWGFGDALMRRLELPEDGSKKLRRQKPWLWRTWWARLWGVHPSNSVRRGVLVHPTRLFEISYDLPFLTGTLLGLLAFGIMAMSLPGMLSLAAAAEWVHSALLAVADRLPRTMRGPAYLGAALGARMLLPAGLLTLTLGGVTLLVTRALGVQTQRSAIAQLADSPGKGWGYLRLVCPAALFASGVEAGLLLTPWISPTFLYSRPLASVAWMLAFTGLTWLWLVYIHAFTRLFVASRGGWKAPTWIRRLVLITATGLLTSVFWPALWGRMTLHGRDAVKLVSPQHLMGIDPQQFFLVMLLVMTFVLALLAAVVFLLGFGLLLLTATVRLAFLKIRCSLCGEPSRHRLAVGRRCEGCGYPLALWAYALSQEITP